MLCATFGRRIGNGLAKEVSESDNHEQRPRTSGEAAMTTYETSAMVQAEGEVRVVGVPLAPGTEVEVTISPKEKTNFLQTTGVRGTGGS